MLNIETNPVGQSFFPSLTHISVNRRSTNSLLGQAAAEKILPLDILSFWHNIDFRGDVAGGLLVTFHITLEIYAQLSVCANSSGGGGGWRERVGGWGRGMMKEGEMGRKRDECTDKYSSSKTVQAFTVICHIFTAHRFTSTSIPFSH